MKAQTTYKSLTAGLLSILLLGLGACQATPVHEPTGLTGEPSVSAKAKYETRKLVSHSRGGIRTRTVRVRVD